MIADTQRAKLSIARPTANNTWWKCGACQAIIAKFENDTLYCAKGSKYDELEKCWKPDRKNLVMLRKYNRQAPLTKPIERRALIHCWHCSSVQLVDTTEAE